MTCPKCASEAICVMDTMHGNDGHIYRRRKCLDCTTIFHTAEIVIGAGSHLKYGYSEAQRLKNKQKEERANAVHTE